MTTRSILHFLKGMLFLLALLVMPALAPPAFANEDSHSSAMMTDRQKADVLFNWIEALFPDLFPQTTPTQENEEGVIYRYYLWPISSPPSTGKFLVTYLGDLYFIGYNTFIPLGNVDDLLSYAQNS